MMAAEPPSAGPPPGSGQQATETEGSHPELDRLREQIEEIDRTLIQQIARRVELARRVGTVKKQAGLPTLDPRREAAVVRRAAADAREAGLAEEDTRAIFWQLVGLCRRAQL